MTRRAGNGSVVRWNVVQGEEVEPGSAVDVRIAKSVETVQIPVEIVGRTLAEVQGEPGALGLRTAVIVVAEDASAGTSEGGDSGDGSSGDPHPRSPRPQMVGGSVVLCDPLADLPICTSLSKKLFCSWMCN